MVRFAILVKRMVTRDLTILLTRTMNQQVHVDTLHTPTHPET